jgi:ribosomal protein S17
VVECRPISKKKTWKLLETPKNSKEEKSWYRCNLY